MEQKVGAYCVRKYHSRVKEMARKNGVIFIYESLDIGLNQDSGVMTLSSSLCSVCLLSLFLHLCF